VHLDNYQSFSQTDAQLESLKNNFKFAILKAPTCFGVKHHHQFVMLCSVADYRLIRVT
jgi:hypothetical protein